jgi:hypothetical protein
MVRKGLTVGSSAVFDAQLRIRARGDRKSQVSWLNAAVLCGSDGIGPAAVIPHAYYRGNVA